MAAAPLSEYAVHLRPEDNVAVCRRPIPAGTDIAFDGRTLRVPGAIRMGPKFAIVPIKAGDAVLKDYPNVDGVMAIVHRQGCGMQFDGPDHQQLDRTLAGFARHANVGAYILVGLGCEIVQASHLIEQEKLNLVQLNGAKGTPLS